MSREFRDPHSAHRGIVFARCLCVLSIAPINGAGGLFRSAFHFGLPLGLVGSPGTHTLRGGTVPMISLTSVSSLTAVCLSDIRGSA